MSFIKLSQLAREITVGFVGTMAKEFVPTGIPFLRSKNVGRFEINVEDLKFIGPAFHQQIRKSALRPGDVVIVRTGKPGTCAVVPAWLTEANCSDLVIVRCGPELNNRFLAYFINSLGAHHVQSTTVGAVQQHFNVGSAKQMPIPHLPLRDQEAIAATLGALDDKIELNRQTAATLEEMARTLWRSWFVNFDPVRARALGQAPAFMDEATAGLFPDRFNADGLPQGWTEGTLTSIATLSGEKWSSVRHPAAIHYIDLSAVSAGVIDTSTDLPWVDAPSRARMVLRPGDTIVGTVRPGNRAFALIGEAGLTGSTGFAVLRPHEATDHCLLYVAATDVENINRLAHLADGAAYPAVRPEMVAGSPLVVAPPVVRRAYAEITNPLLDRFHRTQKESHTLAALRDTLLPKLMSGELRVREAERLVEEVA